MPPQSLVGRALPKKGHGPLHTGPDFGPPQRRRAVLLVDSNSGAIGSTPLSPCSNCAGLVCNFALGISFFHHSPGRWRVPPRAMTDSKMAGPMMAARKSAFCSALITDPSDGVRFIINKHLAQEVGANGADSQIMAISRT